MEASDVKTVEGLANYISLHKSTIYVREQVKGKWGSYSLSELPTDLAIDHALRFVQQGIVPVRVLDEKEGQNDRT